MMYCTSYKKLKIFFYIPPSSSESDMNVSCILSGAMTLYFSSETDEGTALVTFFKASTTLM